MYREEVGNSRITSPASDRPSKRKRSWRRRQDIMVGDLENGPNISVTTTSQMMTNSSSQPAAEFVNVAETSFLNNGNGYQHGGRHSRE